MPEPKPRERMFWLCCTNRPIAESKLTAETQGHIVAELRERWDEEVGHKVQEWALYADHLSANCVPMVRPRVYAIVPMASRVFCRADGCENTTRITVNMSAWDALVSHYGGQG